jgi:hypothetical protein
MFAEEVFVKYYNFNLNWVQHASIHVKKVLVLKSNKVPVIVKISCKIYSEPGLTEAGAEAGATIRICGSAEPESEPKEIFSVPQH